MPLQAADRALKPLPPTSAPAQDAGILAEIAAGLVAEGDLRLLLERFLDPIVHLAGAQAGAVRVLSETGDQFQLVTGLGLPAGLCSREQAVDRHCGHCGAAADGQELVWASDLRTCSERSASSEFWQGCQRLLAVPLQHRGRVLGVYNLFFAGADEPGADVLAILRSVGELLGLALNNARLEQETLRATLMSERQMMAAEVHDSLAQQLAFVKMRMPLLHDAMRAHDDTRAQQYYDDVRSAVTQAHSSLRGIITHLRSPMDPQGLLHALAASADAFRRSTGAELELANEWPDMKLAPELESQVFHIVQEALTNVARHAAAQHVRLHIGRVPGGQVEIVVEDDGAGLPPAANVTGTHYGLEIMLERARRIGGTLEIGARDGGGTRIRLSFPLHAAEPAALPGQEH
jgi:two-component system nitrate/nitrite sensor histidine kinase NarX